MDLQHSVTIVVCLVELSALTEVKYTLAQKEVSSPTTQLRTEEEYSEREYTLCKWVTKDRIKTEHRMVEEFMHILAELSSNLC